jgi:alcohol dehydrogenase class IV
MRFEFATSDRIIFGAGTLQELGPLARKFGRQAFLATGEGGAQPAQLVELLQAQGVECLLFPISGEPTVDLVREAAEKARTAACDVVIGFGGGSVIDTGKAVSALLTNDGDLFDYLEVIGKGQSLKKEAAPYIAIPTTAGTGAEVTRNAVLASPSHHVKVSLRSPLMLPKVALVDPELTYSLPPEVTASTGMDAITQLIEPFVSIRANPFTDGFCSEGLRKAAPAIRRVYRDGSDRPAREAMSAASLLGGLSLANAGLGAAHGFAAPIGGMFEAPHGAVCARLLAPVMHVNIQVLQERDDQNPVLERFRLIARLLTGDPAASIEDGIAWVEDLCEDLKIPRLSHYGITSADIPRLVENGKQASSMQANPIRLNDDELIEILEMAL